MWRIQPNALTVTALSGGSQRIRSERCFLVRPYDGHIGLFLLVGEEEMIPFLVLSDAPSITTGLARITRELLKHMRTDPEMSSIFRIGTLGIGQRCYISKPYPQYPGTLGVGGVPELMDVWRDFSQGENGIVFTIMNPEWMPWIHEIPRRNFNLWGYFPIDCEGPNGMRKSILETVNRYDRKLAYTSWAARLIDSEHLPHGIDTSIFYPRPKLSHDKLVIGVCATNTSRKDWGLAAETCAILKHRGHKIQLLAHTDHFGHLPELFAEFGLSNDVFLDNARYQEDEMAEWYSLCDVTLAIGSGEGFGYPIAESLACGVPCIHGNYAGGAEITHYHITARGWRYDGLDKRPVFKAVDWVALIEVILTRKMGGKLDSRLDWNNLWPRWKHWLLKGVQ
jgi:glycosyltransferase involved in cell wall biosynthesis